MYKIDIKEALYPIQIVLVVYKKFSKTSVFIDRKWPIPLKMLRPILKLTNQFLGRSAAHFHSFKNSMSD